MKRLGRIITAAIGVGLIALGVLGFSEATVPAVYEAINAYQVDAVVTTQNVVHAVVVWIITGLATISTILGIAAWIKGISS
jgi:hypothetical protein